MLRRDVELVRRLIDPSTGPPPASPTTGASIPPYDRILDPTDGVSYWTVVGGVAKLNGVTVGVNYSVALLLKFPATGTGSAMYHANTSGSWYKLATDGTTWITATDPRLSSYQGFSINNMPPATFRPYSSISPFNTPIEASPTVSSQSASIITKIISDSGGTFPSTLLNEASAAYDFAHPIYYAQQGDPLYTITSSLISSIVGQTLRCPSFAVAAAGTDGHMCVVQPNGDEWDLFAVTLDNTNRTISADYGGRGRYDGPGIVTPQMRTDGLILGTWGGTAPWFGLEAGIIRAAELSAGVIDHALFVVIKTGTTNTTFGNGVVGPNANGVGGAGSSVYPALKGDAADNFVNRAPMGARFQLNMTPAAIDATSAKPWEKTVAKACAKYGAYFGDTGGPGFGFMLESADPYVAAGVPNPMADIVARDGLAAKDATYGYGFPFYTGSNKIDWAGNLRVINPPAAV